LLQRALGSWPLDGFHHRPHRAASRQFLPRVPPSKGRVRRRHAALSFSSPFGSPSSPPAVPIGFLEVICSLRREARRARCRRTRTRAGGCRSRRRRASHARRRRTRHRAQPVLDQRRQPHRMLPLQQQRDRAAWDRVREWHRCAHLRLANLGIPRRAYGRDTLPAIPTGTCPYAYNAVLGSEVTTAADYVRIIKGGSCWSWRAPASRIAGPRGVRGYRRGSAGT
jgi:hypothetical protein